MRTLGDAYVQSEFRQIRKAFLAGNVTGKHEEEFEQQWVKYSQALDPNEATRAPASGELSEHKIAAMSDDQRKQLESLKHSVVAASLMPDPDLPEKDPSSGKNQ